MFFESCEVKLQSKKRFHVVELTAISLLQMKSKIIEFANACGTDAAKNPWPYDTWRQAMYPQENTKNPHAAPKNQKGVNIPCSKPHKPAATTALATEDNDVDSSTLSNHESISVSTIGAKTTILKKLPNVASRAGPE